MLRLDYSLSPSWDGRGGADLTGAEEWVLRYDCFLGDVVFMIDEMDLSARWGWVPVFDFALALNSIVDALAVGAEEEFEFTESDASISFRRTADVVEIEASYVLGAATVGYADLRGEVKRFLRRILQGLVDQHPELGDNPFIAQTFSGSS